MLRRISLQSEAYGSTGNIGENFRRLLGAPTLDALQTTVREAVQNIADAAAGNHGPEILIRVRRLTAVQRMALQRNILSPLPHQITSRKKLSEFLNRSDPLVMEICDFGTVGLGGPTRADRIPENTVRTDFIDFLRNIGTPRDTSHGGGTYGFGKVALYRVSRCSTIIVDSLVSEGGSGSRRLIGCHIGQSFEVPENGMRWRYTGRHWWGHADPLDGVVDPVLDEDAKKIADLLGFPPRQGGRTGTSIMILDFDTEGQTLEWVGQRLVEGLLWNFWPRMLESTPKEKRFACRVEVDGRNCKIPLPEEIAPLHLFAKAMRTLEQGDSERNKRIASLRPQQHLGNLVIERDLRAPRKRIAGEDSLFPDISRHIALMRPVKLVVKYLEGQALPDDRLEWAGVFVADSQDEVERAFADSEPPAHDDWIPDNLPKGPAKTFVNVALRELRSAALDMGALDRGIPTQTETGPPLARVASRLGMALEGALGDGAGPRRGGAGSSGRRPPRARASKPLFARLEKGVDGPVAVFLTQVRQDAVRSGDKLIAKAFVAMDGAAASGVDVPAQQPEVLGIYSASGLLSSDGDSLLLAGSEGDFEVRVRMPRDSAVIVNALVLAGSDES